MLIFVCYLIQNVDTVVPIKCLIVLNLQDFMIFYKMMNGFIT